MSPCKQADFSEYQSTIAVPNLGLTIGALDFMQTEHVVLIIVRVELLQLLLLVPKPVLKLS